MKAVLGDDRISVSVVIPTFNRPDLLRKVLDGLTQQTYHAKQFEVLVCDDGSTVDLTPVIEEFSPQLPGLRLLRQKNQGPAAARNLGIAESRAPLVLFLDSDVLPQAKLIEYLAQAMNRNPAWIGAEARVQPCDGEDNVLWDAPICDAGGVFLTAAIVYRRDALSACGGFDQGFLRAACEDVELAARMLDHGKIGFVKEACVLHPRRRRTFRYYWNKRKDWRYLLYLGLRHGFIGWPANKTNSPRVRLLWCALVTQPLGRLIGSLKLLLRQPNAGIVAVGHALFSWICGLFAVPDLVWSDVPMQRDYLKKELQQHGQ